MTRLRTPFSAMSSSARKAIGSAVFSSAVTRCRVKPPSSTLVVEIVKEDVTSCGMPFAS